MKSCRHSKIEFLGVQCDERGRVRFGLYNCGKCHSTITINEEDGTMQNVKMTVQGDKLNIEVDLSKDFGYSSSGKTKTVAKTGGFTAVDGRPGVILNLNVQKK